MICRDLPYDILTSCKIPDRFNYVMIGKSINSNLTGIIRDFHIVGLRA